MRTCGTEEGNYWIYGEGLIIDKKLLLMKGSELMDWDDGD